MKALESAAEDALKDGNFEVRLAALRAVGRLYTDQKDERATARAGAMMKDDYRSVQVAACEAVGAIGANSGVKPLSDILLSSSIPVKVAVVEALRRIGTSQAMEVVKKYERHPDPRVRRAAMGKS